MAMVALNKAQLPDLAEFSAEWRTRNSATGISDWQQNDVSVVFELERGSVGVGVMPQPIPWSELEGPCLTAWWWPTAASELRGHQAHLIVTYQARDHDPIESRLQLTRVLGVIAKITNAIGVYWGGGTVVWPTVEWLNLCKKMSRDFLPLDLWIDFRVYGTSHHKVDGFTTGLRPFGHLEIEVHASRTDASTVRAGMWNAAHYLLDHGPILNPGDTIGFEPDQRIEITHTASMFDPARKVNRLIF
jgi:hypothetical protein